jgi:hypothetical protein
MIILAKTGYDHLEMGTNRQDVAFATETAKFVMDGCGSMPHAEVGAKLFAQTFVSFGHKGTPDDFESAVDTTMAHLAHAIVDTDEFRFANLSFTILAAIETEEEFVVKACGDGFIIAVTVNGKIALTQLDNGDYPEYYIYNFIADRSNLLCYEGGVKFRTFHFPKSQYTKVGVATDGYRFVDSLEFLEKMRWEEYLISDKAKRLSQIVNRNQRKFKDDLAICL